MRSRAGARRPARVVLWLLDASEAIAAARARDVLAEQAAGLREMIDAIPLPVWRRDPGGTIVECSRAYAAALCTTRDAVLAEGRELAPVAPSDAVVRRERAHVVIKGVRRLIDISEVADTANGTIGFIVDRSEVEAAQADLRRHTNAHREVLESIHAGVAIYGADRRLQFFNGAFAALWGFAGDWLDAEPTYDEVLEWLRERRQVPEPADFRAFKRERLELFTSLIEPRQELMHLPDGRTMRQSISPHPLGGLTFVYEDVTDHLALECSYNTLAQVQRATLDHLSEGIAVYGADGRLKLHNPAYRTIWGLSGEDVAGEPHIAQIAEKIRALIDDGGDWAARRRSLIDRIIGQTPTSGLLHRRDGSVLQTATVPLPDGEVLVTCLDVSDTARVEQALRDKNEALETAGRLKSEFIANVSYELRTPLNAIIGFTEILTNQYFGPLNARQLDYGRDILASSQQLLALINDILDLATIEAGYLVLQPTRVEIGKMLQAVLALTAERARSQGLTLGLNCPPGIGTIDADETRLKQALFNLISNAIKFTPPGGVVSIEAERAGGDLLLSVADSGIGIAPADHARIFEKFERGARQSGAGLGLALVKNLIELHRGAVVIDSAPERGTRIICRLPARRRARTGSDPSGPAHRFEQGKTPRLTVDAAG